MADAPSLPSVDVAGACELDGEALEGGIEAPRRPARKPRTEKQREAFVKCLEALNRKHESAKKKTPEPIHEEPKVEPPETKVPPEPKPTRRTRTVLHIHDYPKPEPPPNPPRKRAPPRPKPATYEPPPQPVYFHVV